MTPDVEGTREPSGSNYDQLLRKLRGGHIPALDGLRAIAVFLVIFYHLGIELGIPILPGPLGVLGFFVLSGFLITWLLIGESDKYGQVSLYTFYKRRTLRIFPAFYTFWTVALVGHVVRGAKIPWPQALTAFFYVSDYFYALFHPQSQYMMHTWSLAVEEQFYLLWPVCFVVLHRKRRKLCYILLVAIGSLWLYRAVLWKVLAARDYISYAFDTRVDAILVGCLLALALRIGLLRGLLDEICSRVWMPALTILAVTCSVLIEQSSAGFATAYRLMIGLAIEPFLVAVLICQLIALSGRGPWRLLDSAPMRYLGTISYPLYLYHGTVTGEAERVFPRNHFACVIITVAGAVIVASASYYLVERPFLRLKERWAK